MTRSSRRRASCCLLAVILLVGCGDGLGRVSGTVTLDGSPIRADADTRCTVTFYPAGGAGATPSGVVDETGKFELGTGAVDGVEPGEYKVAVSASQLVGDAQPGVPRSGKRLTPAAYGDPNQSGLTATVKPGGNQFDFALSSDSP